MATGLLNNSASSRDSQKTASYDVWGGRVQSAACVASVMAVWSFGDAEPGAHPLGGLCKVPLFSCLYESKWGDSHAARQTIESAFIQRALLPCLCGEMCAPASPRPTTASPQHPVSMFSSTRRDALRCVTQISPEAALLNGGWGLFREAKSGPTNMGLATMHSRHLKTRIL